MPAHKIIIAQNTIDIEAIINRCDEWKREGENIRKLLGLENKVVIIYVGGISKIKRVDILIKAIEIMLNKRADLACLIIGKGESLDELKNRCVERKISQIYFMGEIIEGVEAYIASGDVFVLPGTGGLALNQAMALQKPIIATIADGTQLDLIVPGENGEIVEVDSVDSLITGLEKVLQNKENLHQMGLRSQEILLDRASLRNMVERFTEMFDRMNMKNGNSENE